MSCSIHHSALPAKVCVLRLRRSLVTRTVVSSPDIFFCHRYRTVRMGLSLTHSVLSVIFPGERVLAGFIRAKGDGGDGDNWSCKTCKAPVKSSPPTNQHPTFYRPDSGYPSCRPINSVKALEFWRVIGEFYEKLVLTDVVVAGTHACYNIYIKITMRQTSDSIIT